MHNPGFWIFGVTNLDLADIFSDSRSGTIAHKNKKRITAVTQCQKESLLRYSFQRM